MTRISDVEMLNEGARVTADLEFSRHAAHMRDRREMVSERQHALATASLALQPVEERLAAVLETAQPRRLDDGKMRLRHEGLRCIIPLQNGPLGIGKDLVIEAQPYGLILCWRTGEENLTQYFRPRSNQADLVMKWATGVLGMGPYIKSTLQHRSGFSAKPPAHKALA
jgi:hypothetical protein